MEDSNNTTPITTAKKPKGMAIGMAICSVLALAGVGFGIYGMVSASNKSVNTADMKVQVKSEDGTITTLETEQIETKTEDGKTVTVVETPTIATRNQIYSQPQRLEVIYDSGNSYRDELTIAIANGKVTSCSVTRKEYASNGGSAGRRLNECDLGIQGEISRVIEGGLGQSYLGGFVFFIMTDGSVYYIHPQTVLKTGDWTAKKFETGEFIADAFMSVGNGADTVFITNTGKVLLLSDYPEMMALTMAN